MWAFTLSLHYGNWLYVYNSLISAHFSSDEKAFINRLFPNINKESQAKTGLFIEVGKIYATDINLKPKAANFLLCKKGGWGARLQVETGLACKACRGVS